MTNPRISIIMPCFYRSDYFKRAIVFNAPVFNRNDCELVLALDGDQPDDYIKWAEQKHMARVRIVSNPNAHNWRPPCVAINTAVRHAQGDYIAIMSPETILNVAGDALANSCHVPLMIGGLLWNVSGLDGVPTDNDIHRRIQHMEVTQPPASPGYGFLMCLRAAFEAINGMDEGRQTYGGDDDDIRIRLLRYGLQWIIDPSIRLYHLWHANIQRAPKVELVSRNVCLDHQPDWGKREKWEVIYDWAKA